MQASSLEDQSKARRREVGSESVKRKVRVADSIETAPSVAALERSAVPSRAPAPVVETEAGADAPDRSEVLAAVLDGAFATDERPTAASLSRERAIRALFTPEKIDGLGSLEQLECRLTTCRGMIRSENAKADGQVISRTLLSPEYAQAIGEAFTVSEREIRSDGSILAKFFIHPQSMFRMVAE